MCFNHPPILSLCAHIKPNDCMLVHDVSVILLEAGKSLVKKLKSEVPKSPPIMFPNSDLDCTCTNLPDSLVNFISPVRVHVCW